MGCLLGFNDVYVSDTFVLTLVSCIAHVTFFRLEFVDMVGVWRYVRLLDGYATMIIVKCRAVC